MLYKWNISKLNLLIIIKENIDFLFLKNKTNILKINYILQNLNKTIKKNYSFLLKKNNKVRNINNYINTEYDNFINFINIHYKDFYLIKKKKFLIKSNMRRF